MINDILVFVSGFVSGGVTVGVIGGVYVKRKIEKMKQSGLGGLGDMMNNMAESMAESMDVPDEEAEKNDE